MSFIVTIRATSITVQSGTEALIPLTPLLDMHEYEDEYEDTTKVLGYALDEEHDTLYLHKGVNLDYLRRLLKDVEFKYDLFDAYKEMNYEFEEAFPPKNDDQRSAIRFIAGEKEYSSNINDSQIFLVLTTGFGKSFCGGYGAGVLGMKTLIIVHRDSLRKQWYDSLKELNGYTSKELYLLMNSAELESIANGDTELDYDVYIMTHATFQAACARIKDPEKIRNITKNLHIGFKIIDEAHLYFKDTLFMDFMFNVKRNLYLTATDGRSSRDEDAIFKHVFSNATYYKKETPSDQSHPDKWVEYITVKIDTKCLPAMYRYKVNGGRGMSAITYGKWVIQYDKKHTHFKVCRDIVRQLINDQPDSKIIIFMPLIDLCTDCACFLNLTLNNDPNFEYNLEIKTVNSHNSKSDNAYNKKHADVIVTTIQSLGTGEDIKGVTDIINCSPIVSKITVKQVLGRIRYIPKKCHYYDIVDKSVPSDVYWWKSRYKRFRPLTTKYTELEWFEEENDNDADKINS